MPPRAGRAVTAAGPVAPADARAAALIEAALDCVILIDGDGRITEFNSAATRTFGYERDEVLGREMAEVIVPPPLREAHRRGLARYLATGEARVLGRRIEMVGMRRDGSEFPAELAIVAIKSDGPVAFAGFLRDQTDPARINAERAALVAQLEGTNATLLDAASRLETQAVELEQQTEEAQALTEELESANELLHETASEAEAAREAALAAERRAVGNVERVSDLFVAYDADFRFRYLNPPAAAFFRALGADPTELLGRQLWEVVPGLRGTAFEAESLRAVRDQETAELEVFFESVGRWFRTRIYPAVDGVSSYAQDITGRKRVEQNAQFLDSLDGLLSGALLDYDATLAAVARHAVPYLADYASVDILTEEGQVRRIAAAHRDPAKEPLLVELWERFPYSASDDAGAPVVLRTGTPQLNPEFAPGEIEAFARSPDQLAMLRILNPRSYLAVPLMFGGRMLGALSLVMSDSGRRFDARALELATELARRAAAAVEGARLYRDAERARKAAAVESARDAFLARASELLASSLDHEQTLSAVARLTVPGLADWCSIYTVEPGGTPRRLAVAHVDPARVEWARALQERYPPDPEAATGLPHVLRTGVAEFHPQITDDMLVRGARDAEHLRLMRQLGLTSVLIVPMVARGQTLGAITLVSAESGRRYTNADVALAEEVARRAGVAIDNARLLEAEQTARAQAERAMEQTRRLQEVTAALAATATTDDIAQAMLADGLRAVGAIGGVVCRLDKTGSEVERVWALGYPAEGLEQFRRVALTAALPPRDVVATRAPVFIENPAQWDARYLPPGPGMTTAAAAAALPLLVGDRLVGVMVLRFPTSRAFPPDDRALMMNVANQCAQALERSRLYEAEQSAREAAEAALRAKATFLGTMSHELRTPVNAVLGYAELLETGVRGPMTPEQAEDLRRIRRASGHLLGLINDLLNYTKLEAHQVRFGNEPVEISSVVAEAALMIEPQTRSKGVAFHCAPCDAALVARGDREKVLQIVLNLLSNAVKFTPAGGSVVLSAAPDTGIGPAAVRIQVHDTGRGIPADQLDHIFEPFVQVGRTLTSADQGAGLGLAISRELALGMGGSLIAESSVAGGSTFTLTLPRSDEQPDQPAP